MSGHRTIFPQDGPTGSALLPTENSGYQHNGISLVHQLGGDGYDFPRQPTMLSTTPYGGTARLATREQEFHKATAFARGVIAAFFQDPHEVIRAFVPIVPFEGEKIEIDMIISKIAPWGPLANQAPLTEVHLKRDAFRMSMQAFGRQFTIDDSVKGLTLGNIYESTHTQQLISEMHMTLYVEFFKTLLNGYTMYALEHVAALNFDNLMAEQARESAVDLMGRMTGVMSRSLMQGAHPLVHVVQTARQLLRKVSDYNDISLNSMIMHEELQDQLELTRRSFASSVTDQNLLVIREYMQRTLGIDPQLQHLMEIVDWPSLYGMKVHFMTPFRTEEPGNIDLLTHEYATVQFVAVQLPTPESGTAPPVKLTMWDYRAKKECVVSSHVANDSIVDWFGKDTDFGGPMKYDKAAIALRTVRLRTRSLVLASMGHQTGMVFVGNSFGKKYDEPALRRATTMMAVQFGVAIYAPNHVIILPDASFVRYLKGCSAARIDPKKNPDALESYARNLRGDRGREDAGDVVLYGIPYSSDDGHHSCGAPEVCNAAHFKRLGDMQWLNSSGVWDDEGLYSSSLHNFINPCTLKALKTQIQAAERESVRTCVHAPFPIENIWRHGFHVSFFACAHVYTHTQNMI